MKNFIPKSDGLTLQYGVFLLVIAINISGFQASALHRAVIWRFLGLGHSIFCKRISLSLVPLHFARLPLGILRRPAVFHWTPQELRHNHLKTSGDAKTCWDLDTERHGFCTSRI
jgi:hypothetical protein